MKPYMKDKSSIWLGDFEEENIIPKGLRNRDLESYAGNLDEDGRSQSRGLSQGGGLSRLGSLGPQAYHKQMEVNSMIRATLNG
jgi:hypothetical protein